MLSSLSEYSSAFLILLSVNTVEKVLQILILFSEHWSRQSSFSCGSPLVFPRLSRITQRGYRQRVHTNTLTHFFLLFSFFLFSLFFSFLFFFLFSSFSYFSFLFCFVLSIGVNQECLLYFNFPILLSVDTVKDFVLLLNLSIGVDWMHIYHSKRLKRYSKSKQFML